MWLLKTCMISVAFPTSRNISWNVHERNSVIKKASTLVTDVIAEYDQVKSIKENASILYILGD